MLFDWIKALHLISIVLWMGSMLAIGVLVTLASKTPQAERAPMSDLARQLYLRLSAPAMALTLFAGVGMISVYGMSYFRTAGWLHTKLLFVLGLMGVDHVLMRRAKTVARAGEGEPSPAIKPLLTGAVLAMAAVVFAVVKPFS